jgi:hypothetical protein
VGARFRLNFVAVIEAQHADMHSQEIGGSEHVGADQRHAISAALAFSPERNQFWKR